jgi:S-adenosylmethionine:tRNA ribosyltransferase-isomerase
MTFVLPPELEAAEPPEARGLSRDGVRLLVSRRSNDEINHTTFFRIGDYLDAGDLLVVNTSGTMSAAIPARRDDGISLELHLSTHLPDGNWSVELRNLTPSGTTPCLTAHAGEVLALPGGAQIQLLEPYSRNATASHGPRLWIANLHLSAPIDDYLQRFGFPIRYSYVPELWPSSYYQTVFATETGSAEMPGAGRAFTPELVTRLVAHGVQFAPLLLHTGVASLEDHEPPYAEYFRVPEDTARAVNAARAAGRRVIAIGTTVVRALESVTDSAGVTRQGEGWTEVLVTPDSGVRSATGILTGLHEPQATHLAMLEAFVERPRLESVYDELRRQRYLWHEFGDLHLLLP